MFYQSVYYGPPAITGNYSSGDYGAFKRSDEMMKRDSNITISDGDVQYVEVQSGFLDVVLAMDFRPSTREPYYIGGRNRLYYGPGKTQYELDGEPRFKNITGCTFTSSATWHAAFEYSPEVLHAFSDGGEHYIIDPDTAVCTAATSITGVKIVGSAFAHNDQLFVLDKTSNSFGSLDLTTQQYTPIVTLLDQSYLATVLLFFDADFMQDGSLLVVTATIVPDTYTVQIRSINTQTGELSEARESTVYNFNGFNILPTRSVAPTSSATSSPTSSATNSPTSSATNSPTSSATSSPTSSATSSPTSSATSSPTSSATSSPPTQTPGSSDYVITYTGYKDTTCGETDPTVTGQIFAYTCAPERVKAPQSGKITAVTDDYLTSCDYSDTQCNDLLLCENYQNDLCYGYSSFSNKYTWTVSDGVLSIYYTSYIDGNCTTIAESSPIYKDICAEEKTEKPRSGMITVINDDYLISCDYSDTNCQQQLLCETYRNQGCYGSSVTSYSDKYSWVRTSASTPSPTQNSDSASASPFADYSEEGDADDWAIAYTAYSDNTCSQVDGEMSGVLSAYTCAQENRRTVQSGKVVFINDEYLTSCDYSDNNCTTQTVCEDYQNGKCYASENTQFSNKYSWVDSAAGGYVITYTSYTDQACSEEKQDVSGEIFEGACSEEVAVQPQSGKIVFITDEYLISCDYSDTDCKIPTVCENYTNSLCYDSPTTAFSNMYSWRRMRSSASSTLINLLLSSLLVVAVVLL